MHAGNGKVCEVGAHSLGKWKESRLRSDANGPECHAKDFIF